MPSSHLTETVDFWTARAVVAARHLMRLYRVLGDEKQAANASQSGAPAEERAERLGLATRIAVLQALFVEEHPEEVAGEACAWQTLVEAQAGICAFHAMVDGHPEETRDLKGARRATAKALQRAILGYRVAFPEAMANEGIAKALRAAAERCSETFLADLDDGTCPEDLAEVAREIHRDILAALFAVAEPAGLG